MYKKQSGAVLVVSLVILIALTLLVLSTTHSTLMQEKMTSAARDGHISFEVAESGVKDAEAVIESLAGISSFNDDGTGGRYSENNGPADVFADAVWVDSKTSVASTSTTGTVLSRYYIEHLGMYSVEEDLSGVNVTGYGETTGGGNVHGFKIVSRSTGADGNTKRFIVSYYGKRFQFACF